MGDNFHSDLKMFVKSKDNKSATRVILNELAQSLVKDRESFIDVLQSAGINVLNSATDAQLVGAFTENAAKNKRLLLGAAFLVNHRNQTVSFDGEQEVSDAGVKATYKVLDEYFNAGGADPVSAVANAIKSSVEVGGQVFGKVSANQDIKKRGASTLLAQQTSARKEMIQNVLAQRQKEAEEKAKEGGKSKRTLLIVGGISLALIIGVGIYFAVKKNK